MSYRSAKSSNGRKITRIAPISTIFEPIESKRHYLFPKKISNKRKVFEKLFIVAAAVVVGRFRLDRIGVVHRRRVVGGLGSARILLIVSLIVSGSVLGGFLLLDGLLDLPGTARRFLPRRLRGLRGLRGLFCAPHVDRSVRPCRLAQRPIGVAAIRVTSNLVFLFRRPGATHWSISGTPGWKRVAIITGRDASG